MDVTNPDVHIEESTNEKPQFEIVESPEGVQEPEHTQSETENAIFSGVETSTRCFKQFGR
jgi:hypothetical protein